MKVECPYNILSLSVASISAHAKIEKYILDNGAEKMGDIESEIIKIMIQTNNAGVANFHQISIETLVNSRNYEILKKEAFDNFIQQVLSLFKRTFAMNDKEAWSIIHNQDVTSWA